MKLCNLDQQFVLNLTLVFYRYGYSKANDINYFEFFKTELTSKQMKYIGSLFISVFVYSKVTPKHFLHMFKNRVRRSLPLLLNPHLLICSTKVQFLVH